MKINLIDLFLFINYLFEVLLVNNNNNELKIN